MLDKSRKEISLIDDELLKLLNKRMRISQDIASYKKRLGEEIFLPSKEAKSLERLKALNTGPLDDEKIEKIFYLLFGLSKAAQGSLKIGFKGKKARALARELFFEEKNFVEKKSYYELFLALFKEDIKYLILKSFKNDELFFMLNYFKPFIYAKYSRGKKDFYILSKNKNILKKAKLHAMLIENKKTLLDFLEKKDYFLLKGELYSYVESPCKLDLPCLDLGSFQIFKKC